MVLKLTTMLELLLGGLVVRVEDCQAGMPGLNLPRHSGIFFFLKNSRDLHFDNIC